MKHVVKFAEGSRDLIEGMLAPFGGPFKGKDLDGEFFSAKTAFELEWFGDWQRPLLYHHGLDPEIKTAVVGRIKVTPTDKGLWMEGQLDKAHEYASAVADLVDSGTMGLSSGSVSHLIETDAKSGEIKRWPLIEGSLTPTPANPEAKAAPVKYAMKSADAIEHLAVLGVAAPEGIEEPKGAKSYPAWDASTAASLISSLASLLGSCDDEAMCDQLRTAIDSLTAYMTSSVAAVGTEDDMAAMKAITTVLTPQALHDAATVSGAKCPGEMDGKSAPAPLLAVAGKSVEPAPAIDLEALQRDMSALAVKTAQELLAP